ncbi:hypothetical protein EV193_10242 [Herbihabitans rhizosphaerae]|uniref:Uncharacterized protein n=1 Tax=Herbihabitans rhizosphaerae TaxID=1872711 RepID=A0A4Q7L1X3_9PSEU|nr:DUF6461 domain-containing protein [Herbihabitans rhizosphaerae]RZS43066.1 hypothetical protein EV193_10242 [Herbihabitans rhizosphaerae]
MGDWDWVITGDSPFSPGGCLTFAKGLAPEEMFRAFDLDPSSARPMTPEQVDTDPVLSTAGYEEGPQWIRVAEDAGWTVAIEFIQMKGEQDNIALRLAATTDVVCVSFNAKGFGTVTYLREGGVVVSFGVGQPYETRVGREPGFLDTELRAAGLVTGDLFTGGELVPALELLTERFGVRLSRERYAEPLPTAYREHLYRYPLPGFPPRS